ncbi:hypothetical protein ABIF66_006000 [Bradyrhizobium japonicum]
MNPNLTPVTSYVIDNVHHAHDEVCERTDLVERPVGRSKSPGYGHLKLPHLMIAVSAAEQQ